MGHRLVISAQMIRQIRFRARSHRANGRSDHVTQVLLHVCCYLTRHFMYIYSVVIIRESQDCRVAQSLLRVRLCLQNSLVH